MTNLTNNDFKHTIQGASNEAALEKKCRQMEKALIQLRDCDWVITLPDRIDAVRKIAREALQH